MEKKVLDVLLSDDVTSGEVADLLLELKELLDVIEPEQDIVYEIMYWAIVTKYNGMVEGAV